MALARKPRRSRRVARRRRIPLKKTRTRRTTRRAPRRSMTRKQILDLTSRKKRDTMLTWTNTSATGAQTTPGPRPFTVNGARTGWTVYCPTARTLLTNGVTNQLIDEADRTAHTCYMVAFNEQIKIQTSSAVPWLWRRICFTLKDTDGPFQIIQPGDTAPTAPGMSFADTSNGMTRTYLDVGINNIPNTFVAQRNLLFKGQEGLDWNDTMTAPIDTTRVTLKYDRKISLYSGNTSGCFREFKRSHVMKKNLTYNDDETGPNEQGSYFSTSSKMGMGDYFIVDIFQPGFGSSSTDLLALTSTSTLYWHEKS